VKDIKLVEEGQIKSYEKRKRRILGGRYNRLKSIIFRVKQRNSIRQ
jgi:hypothetical protein